MLEFDRALKSKDTFELNSKNLISEIESLLNMENWTNTALKRLIDCIMVNKKVMSILFLRYSVKINNIQNDAPLSYRASFNTTYSSSSFSKPAYQLNRYTLTLQK